ncbi:hypothetical protein [Calycomorphotria hydatis]|uniref:Uncharacterized protein n=1 Tax=Calycomorphotria hydatis TaxID=2528027 RepID=A0A517T4J0_9PLAN|nr:hypothetical protein [Calycomorphotria hydatis]QDT63279.1 hypothetical protein V22_04980 [Calycomorphotria hydatis]
MNARLPEDVEQLVAEHPDGAVRVEGARGHYYILNAEAMKVREEVLEGIQEADRGETSEWDVENILLEAKTRKAQQSE